MNIQENLINPHIFNKERILQSDTNGEFFTFKKLILNSKFINNTAMGCGGAIAVENSELKLFNNIFLQNMA